MASSPKRDLTPEAEVGLKPDEMLKVFRPILPSILAKELKKLLKIVIKRKLRV
jgi:hypothetical protein